MANGLPMHCLVLYVTCFRHYPKRIHFLQGSDFTNVYIRSTAHPLIDAENDLRLADELRYVKFSSIAWTHDSKGFFYQVCLALFQRTHFMTSFRDSPIVRRMVQRIRIRPVRRLDVTKTLSFVTIESALINLRMSWS